MMAPQVQSRRLHFVRRADDGDLAVYCDPDKAEQVLLNLLSNAVKFTAPGGTIELRSCAAGGVAHISVRDSGVGIPEDRLDAIFEPFVQVERSLTTPSEGAGLGLAISRDLARAMGGDLRVKSTIGHGSTFTFELPLATEAAAKRPADQDLDPLRLEA